MLGKPNGKFRAPDYYEAGVEADGIAIGLRNDDKRPDLAVADFNQDVVSVLHGAQGGGFDDGPTLPTPGGPGYIVARDLNRDDRHDLVVANYNVDGTDAISVFLRDDDGFADRVDYDAAGGSAGFLLRPLDSDKRPDVISQDESGHRHSACMEAAPSLGFRPGRAVDF